MAHVCYPQFLHIAIFHNLSKALWVGGRGLHAHSAPCKEPVPPEPVGLGLAVDPLAQAHVCSLVNEALDHGLSKHLRVSCLIWGHQGHSGHTQKQALSWADLLRRTREQGCPRAGLGLLHLVLAQVNAEEQGPEIWPRTEVISYGSC